MKFSYTKNMESDFFFFTKNLNLKKKNLRFFRGGARLSDFFTMNPNLK